ncbi:MAG: NAD(P)H-dependent glycerol-3-phosphate dehydrogenase [Candidatus Zipacnadales bacterium]
MTRSDVSPVAVIGAGGWGTALACLAGEKGTRTRLWAFEPEVAEEINARHTNERYLSGASIPAVVKASTSLAEVLQGVRLVIFAVPSRWLREVARQAAPYLPFRTWVVSATKGIEANTGLRMTQVLTEVLGQDTPMAALSGPNLSHEIARGMPAAAVVASKHPELSLAAQDLLLSPRFRVYTNADIVGVELGGALKNILALAAGASDGLGFGANTKAALLTRGLAEIRRLGLDLGARADTFAGLSGIGDLMATCFSPLSRNWQVGYRLAQGESLVTIEASMGGQVAEGVPTTFAACKLAAERGIEMPIAEAVRDVLAGEVPPDQAVAHLMARESRTEVDSPPLPA